MVYLGEKLRDLLKQHGSFETLEIVVKKYHKSLLGQSKAGGWYTRQYLLTVAQWTK